MDTFDLATLRGSRPLTVAASSFFLFDQGRPQDGVLDADRRPMEAQWASAYCTFWVGSTRST